MAALTICMLASGTIRAARSRNGGDSRSTMSGVYIPPRATDGGPRRARAANSDEVPVASAFGRGRTFRRKEPYATGSRRSVAVGHSAGISM